MDMDPREFYDALADDYELIYADWSASVRHQGTVLAALLSKPARVLDVACGIGTQSIGLALNGSAVLGRDLSSRSVVRAGEAARRFGVAAEFEVGDMREAQPADAGQFDAVIACDNALPHLDSDVELARALAAMHGALGAGGTVAISTRDYDALLVERPRLDSPRVLGTGADERVVLQIWHWDGERHYDFEIVILTRDPDGEWCARTHRARYRAIRRDELAALATTAGFVDVEWLEPAASGFHQPVLRARRR